MAWTAPATWSVSEVVVASKMNAHIRDNLSYLKGLAGAVTIDDVLASVMTTGASIEAQGTASPSDARLRLLAKQAAGTVVDWRIFANALSGVGEFSIYDTTAAAERLRISALTGNVGIGNTAPQGKLHVSGPAGGGFAVFSANDVTSLQTPVVAGTVVSGCAMWLWDRNNTGGVALLGFNGQSFSLGSAPTYVNTDTITVTLTAGGAITVQRTTGTNGSHDINMFILYF